jgi:hypothetical protein
MSDQNIEATLVGLKALGVPVGLKSSKAKKDVQ